MPRLLRGVARTAVIAGTATAVSNRVSRRQANRWTQQSEAEAYEQQQQYAPPPQYAQPAPAPAPAAAAPDPIEQLQRLAELKNQGILTDAEFASAKAKLLAR
jgi:predicted cobalt transporter CbtA